MFVAVAYSPMLSGLRVLGHLAPHSKLRSSANDEALGFRGIAAYVVGKLREDIPVASRIGRAAIYAANEKVFAIADSA